MSGKPEKIHLIPDEWHIERVGRLPDGRLFWSDMQLDFSGPTTRDFVCTFIFDTDGNLVEHTIDLLGDRGSYDRKLTDEICDKHIDALGDFQIADIWIRLFEVSAHGVDFGLICRSPDYFRDESDDDYDDDHWRVEFMPGNTLSFFAPWEDGEYDT